MAVSFQLVERASQSFTSADVKSVKSVFCRDMCVAENTLRGASVELSAFSGQPRRRAKRILLEKVAQPLFRQSQAPPAGGAFSVSGARARHAWQTCVTHMTTIDTMASGDKCCQPTKRRQNDGIWPAHCRFKRRDFSRCDQKSSFCAARQKVERSLLIKRHHMKTSEQGAPSRERP